MAAEKAEAVKVEVTVEASMEARVEAETVVAAKEVATAAVARAARR